MVFYMVYGLVDGIWLVSMVLYGLVDGIWLVSMVFYMVFLMHVL